MANLGALAVFLTADTTKFKKGMKTAKVSVSAFKVATVAALAIASRAVARYSAEAVAAHKVQEKAERKLQGVLTATQSAVGHTAQELTAYAAQMQKDMGVADGEIINHMAILATFRNVQGKVFTQGIKLVEDLAVVLGTEGRSAAIQLGKALNDPVKGVNALAEAGIQFTKTQKAQINKMVELNDVAGAQALILKELEMQFGGTAAAIAQTDVGKLDQLTMSMGDMSESVGELVLSLLPLKLLSEVTEGMGIAAKDYATFAGLLTKSSKELVNEVGQVAKALGHVAESAPGKKTKAGKNPLDAQIETAIELTNKLRQIRKENTLIGATNTARTKDLRGQLNILDTQIKAQRQQAATQAGTNRLLQMQIEREQLVGKIKQGQLAIDKEIETTKDKAAKEAAKRAKQLPQVGQSIPQLAGAFTARSAQAHSIIAQAQVQNNREVEEQQLSAMEAVQAATEEMARLILNGLQFGTFGVSGG